MKKQTSQLDAARACRAAFTIIELLTILAIIALLMVLLLSALSKAKTRAGLMGCINHLKLTGLAFRLFGTDHSDKYPDSFFTNKAAWPFNLPGTNFVAPHFLMMSNEVNSLRILVCPNDRRKPATTWTNLSDANISYFVGLDADETRPSELLVGDRNLTVDGSAVRGGIMNLNRTNQLGFAAEMHDGEGNVALADGSVQNLTASRLNVQLRSTSNSTQRLAIPR